MGENRVSNTTWEDYFASLPEDEADRARKQFDLPINEFDDRVKCCHNCPNWNRDYSLMGDYAYNNCPVISSREDKKIYMTRWDYCCDEYDGTRTEENLLCGADMRGETEWR